MYKKTNYKKQITTTDFKTTMADSLQLPKDFVLGAAIVTLMGQNEAYIENYKGILEYTTECILVQTKTCQIAVTGKCLTIAYYTNEEMKIVGIIEHVNYCR